MRLERFPNIYEWTEASEAEEDASVRIYMGMKRASYLGRPLGYLKTHQKSRERSIKRTFQCHSDMAL
jgi:hypothetical protein